MSRTKVELFYKGEGVPVTVVCDFISMAGMFLMVSDRSLGHTKYVNLTDVTHYVEYTNYKVKA